MSLKDKVAIVGMGQTKFGENFDMSYHDMIIEACWQAFDNAGIGPEEIQAAWLGTYLPFSWGYEGVAGVSLSEPLNMYPIPVTRVSAYCCTGMEAVRNAAMAIVSGEYDLVLAVGCEKMRDVPGRGSLVAQHVERGHPLYCKGRTAPGMFALLASRYFHEYGIDRRMLAKVAVKNHKHGSLNPLAHFRREITEEMALNAPPVAEPLHLFDCCPTTDGCAAAVLTRADLAKKFTDSYVLIKGVGFNIAAGYYSAQFDQGFSFTGFKSTQIAAQTCYEMAGIREPIEEVDVVELHDCFTITEIVDYEDLGLAPKGEGWKLIADGETYIGGKIPVNTDGGLKTCGHPVGASGVRMINHVAAQILGRAGDMQVDGAEIGIAHTLGGPGAVACVFALGAP